MNNLFKILLISGVSYMIGKRDGIEKSKNKHKTSSIHPTFTNYNKFKTDPPTVNNLSYDDYNKAREALDRILDIACTYDYITLEDIKVIASLEPPRLLDHNWGWFKRDLEDLVIQVNNYYKDFELHRSYIIALPEIKYIREVL